MKDPTGHRLRVTRIALGLSEKQAAADYGITLRTYRKWEDGARQRDCWRLTRGYIAFAEKYDVSLDWLIGGKAANNLGHLAVNRGATVAILPRENKRLPANLFGY